MAMKAVLATLDDVDEALRDQYKEAPDPADPAKKVFVLDIVDVGTLPDVVRLNRALVKEREDHKGTKNKFAPFASLGDPGKVQEMLDRIPELEAAAAGNLDETKISGIVEGRLRSKLAPVERELNAFKARVGEQEQIISTFQSREKSRTVSDAVREAVGKSQGFVATALEDVLLYAERHFEVTDEGKVVTRENVGVTPGLEPSSWLQEMQSRKTHWWGATAGGGANGNRGGANTGDNPWAAGTWNMTKQGEYLRTHGRAKADQMARLAGTTVGGQRPAAKK